MNPISLFVQQSRLAVSTLNKWRCYRTEGPAFLKFGKSVRYRIEDLDAYMVQVTVN